MCRVCAYITLAYPDLYGKNKVLQNSRNAYINAKAVQPPEPMRVPCSYVFHQQEKAALMSFHSVSSKLTACCTSLVQLSVSVALGHVDFKTMNVKKVDKVTIYLFTLQYKIKLLPSDCYIRCTKELSI